MTVKRGEVVNNLLMKRITEKAAIGNAYAVPCSQGRVRALDSGTEQVEGAEQLRLSIPSCTAKA